MHDDAKYLENMLARHTFHVESVCLITRKYAGPEHKK